MPNLVHANSAHWVLVAAILWMVVGGRGHAEPTDVPFVASPQSGAIIRSGVLPVLVRLPVPMRFHTATLVLDGAPLDTVPTVIRRRWWEGKGVDLIASFPTADLSPGWHTLGVVFNAPKTELHGEDPGHTEEWAVADRRFRFAPRAGRLEVQVRDGQGRPRSARIGVYDVTGQPVVIGNRQDANADPSLRDIPRHGFYAGLDGSVEFLKPGKYTVLASGGIRDGADLQHVHVDGITPVTLTVPRLIETPGEVTADLHVHTAMSSDAFVSDTDRFAALVAAGVEVAVVTEHNRVRDPRTALELLQLSQHLQTIAGAEMRIGMVKESIGHVNAFPLDPDQALPALGDASPAEAFGMLRRAQQRSHDGETKGPLLIQLNHPRGIQFYPDKRLRTDAHALFEELNFEPEKPIEQQVDERARALDPVSGSSMLDFDAIEILNRFSVEAWRRVRSDWFALLNRGVRITGTGNADSHTAQHERIGFPVNLVRTEGSSTTAFIRAIVDGRVRVSSGPLVEMSVETPDQTVLPSHQLVSTTAGVVARIRLHAVPWVPVPEVRLVQNGEVIFTAEVGDLGPDMTREWEIPVSLVGDAWLVAEAGWTLDSTERPEGVYGLVAPGHVPIGFTNPVWLDFDGDGEWGTTVEREGLKPPAPPEAAHPQEPASGLSP